MSLMKLNQATFLLLLLATMLAFVSSDFSKDKDECQQQLISLSSCLNYVTGEAKAPSSQCCTVLYKKLNQTKKCLCILVKDRNEPSLGLKLNGTLALRLPSMCHTVSSSLDCLGLLKLNPKSPEARIFIESANITGADAIGNDPTSSSSNGRKPNIWRKMMIYDAFFLMCFFSMFLFNL
ncbi:protein YLS3-like [Chenopodium quinoa]|nr:protein YLS3-like [Chenopodium quinoa]